MEEVTTHELTTVVGVNMATDLKVEMTTGVIQDMGMGYDMKITIKVMTFVVDANCFVLKHAQN